MMHDILFDRGRLQAALRTRLLGVAILPANRSLSLTRTASWQGRKSGRLYDEILQSIVDVAATMRISPILLRIACGDPLLVPADLVPGRQTRRLAPRPRRPQAACSDVVSCCSTGQRSERLVKVDLFPSLPPPHSPSDGRRGASSQHLPPLLRA